MQRHLLFLGLIILLAVGAGWVVKEQPTRQGLDVRGGLRIRLRAEIDKLPPAELQRWNNESMSTVRGILEKRIDILGVIDAYVGVKGTDELIVELPGFTDEAEARKLLQTTARLEFRYAKDTRNQRMPGVRYELDPTEDEAGNEVVRLRDMNDPKDPGRTIKETDPEYAKIIETWPMIIAGGELRRATVQATGMGPPSIALDLTSEGKDKFATATSKYIEQNIAIILDGRIISAPVVRSGNLRDPIIEGNYTPASATQFAKLLTAGALPVSLVEEQIMRIEPTLGSRAWESIMQAGMWGTGIIAVYMLLYYLLPGLLSVIALSLYIVFSVALFKMMGVTFSLPAIAGFILSIGMAVDANILIFERVKEELRYGKTLLASIDAGFKRAFTAIFDSNMCTIITSGFLYYFGTGPVQGFATTLALGVVISFFTAITCTRTLLYALVALGVHPDPKWFGLRRQFGVDVTHEEGERRKGFDFVGRRKLWYSVSVALVLVGLVAWLGLGGLKFGIDFAGGSELIVKSEQPIASSLSEIDRLLNGAGYQRTSAQFAEGNQQLILHIADGKDEDRTKVMEALKPIGTLEEVSYAAISARVRDEIVYNALLAVVLSLGFIMFYITIRFAIEGGWTGLKFGVCALIATFHDALVVVGAAALFGYLLNWQVNSLFLTAILTLIGFSVHDTIVVFDRIRENLKHRQRGEQFEQIVNKSILQTLARSINTTLTVVIAVTALLFFGSVSHDLRHFYVAMLVGLISGTYSSIFNASQLIIDWDNMRRRSAERQASAMTATATGKPMQATPKAGVDRSDEEDKSASATKSAPSKPAKRKRRY